MSSYASGKISIPRNRDFRIEVNESQKFKIRCLLGFAEFKGAELVNDRWYVFTDAKTSIFTFSGCELEYEGECDLFYIGERSSYPKLFDIYSTFKKDERILLIGEGKSTMAITLSNYSIRDKRTVFFGEIDPQKGNIFPGTLSCMKVENITLDQFQLNNPHCLFFGSKEIENMELYEMQMQEIAKKMNTLSDDSTVILSAPFIDYNLLDKMIQAFKITQVVVSKDERLYNRLKMQVKSNSNKKSGEPTEPEENSPQEGDILPEEDAKKIKLSEAPPKQLGEVSISFVSTTGFTYENKVSRSIKRYFNGEIYGEQNDIFSKRAVYTASRIVLNNKNNTFTVVKIGEEFMAPDSALPLGASRKVGVMGVEEVELVENSVLAISEATEQEDVALSPIVGFLVCLDEKKGRVLSIQPKLPKMSFIIQGNIKHIEF